MNQWILDCIRAQKARLDAILPPMGTQIIQKRRMREIAEHSIVINDIHHRQVEETQAGICHLLCYGFIEHPE